MNREELDRRLMYENVQQVYGGIVAYWSEENVGNAGWENSLPSGVLAALTPDEIEWFDKNWKLGDNADH